MKRWRPLAWISSTCRSSYLKRRALRPRKQGRDACAPRPLREWVVTSTRKRSSCATAARRSWQVFVFSALHQSLRSQRAVTKPHGRLRPRLEHPSSSHVRPSLPTPLVTRARDPERSHSRPIDVQGERGRGLRIHDSVLTTSVCFAAGRAANSWAGAKNANCRNSSPNSTSHSMRD